MQFALRRGRLARERQAPRGSDSPGQPGGQQSRTPCQRWQNTLLGMPIPDTPFVCHITLGVRLNPQQGIW